MVVGDQCMYGQVAINKKGKVEGVARKRTMHFTNNASVAEEIARKCDGSHKHVSLEGGRAKAAARYPEGLCEAICRGYMKELRKKWKDYGGWPGLSPIRK